MVRGLVVVVALAIAAGWWMHERLLNSIPDRKRFDGAVALLKNEAFSDRKVTFTVSSGVADSQSHLQFEVVVCGGAGRFEGLVLLFGDARLVAARSVQPGAAGAELTDFLPESGSASSGPGVQVFKISMSTVFACPDVDVETVNGAAFVFGGETAVPVGEVHRYGWFDSPRTGFTFPAIGAIPGVNPTMAGPFGNPLDGSDETQWFRGFPLTYRARLEATSTQRAEFVEPSATGSIGIGTVTWSSSPLSAVSKIGRRGPDPHAADEAVVARDPSRRVDLRRSEPAMEHF